MVGFDKKTIRDIDVKGRRVLLRADYNVPLAGGKVVEDYRIKQSLPTLQFLRDKGASAIIIISHLGRPNGRVDQRFSLKPVASRLEKLLDEKVEFGHDCIGEVAEQAVADLKPGGILLLENLRFHAGEEANDPAFAAELVRASSAEVFIQDGFGVVHRKHASTDAITKYLPSVAGLLLEREISTLSEAIKNPLRPLTALVGGAKISDKIDILKKFIELADCVAVAGAMANNFLLADRQSIGQSLVEKQKLTEAKEILHLAESTARQRPFQFIVPNDAIVSTSADGTKPTRVVDFGSRLADVEAYPKIARAAASEVRSDEKILDIGSASAARIAGVIGMSRMVIWNGTCGVTETAGIAGAPAPFSHGTEIVVEAMIGESRQSKSRPKTIVGGGDTASYLEQKELMDEFGFVSTGGGAALELLAGHKLPGVEALADRPS